MPAEPVKAVYRSLANGFERRRRARIRFATAGGQGRAPTVYFLAPDYDRPAGGTMTMYRHVDILNSGGINAYALHEHPGFRYSWFENATPVASLRHARFAGDDLLVLSELDVDLVDRPGFPIRHVIFNQSGHLTWTRGAEAVSRHYRNSKELAAVVVVSAHSEALLRHAFARLHVRRVHLGLDRTLFHAPEEPSGSRIAYMPRRGQGDAELALTLLRNRGALDGWEVVVLDGLSHAEVAAQLRTTKIFLSVPYQEGFGLPAAEAMACGNYVVGYDGYGGREFFDAAYSAPVQTGDVLGLARAAEQAIASERAAPGWCFERGRRASAFVLSTYSLERERRDVLGLYGELLNSPRAAVA